LGPDRATPDRGRLILDPSGGAPERRITYEGPGTGNRRQSDTTVQPKNITLPTDAKLLHAAIIQFAHPVTRRMLARTPRVWAVGRRIDTIYNRRQYFFDQSCTVK
jgi:hypothetical protein